MRSLIGSWRNWSLDPLIKDQELFYGKQWTPDSIKKWQLEHFNEEWNKTSRYVPYFHDLKMREALPDRFRDWEEFKDRIPIMERKTLQRETERLANKLRRPDFFRTTGGSTAEPVQIHAWRSEGRISARDLWYARSWFGIKPSDKLFLIWGHRHLLGDGLGGWWNGVKRKGKDRLLGYHRFSAYDLSDKKMALAAEKLLEFQPSYILGYSVALDRFARVNYSNRSAFHKLGLKAVIATAESFPREDSREMVQEVFGCPVVMEYGAEETGLLAHETPSGGYSVFWQDFFLEGQSSKRAPGKWELLVTTLYPRCVPLIRYRIGDLVDGEPSELNRAFGTVVGRCNDSITLTSQQVVHSQAFNHAVSGISSIVAFQVVQSRQGNIRLNYVASRSLEVGEESEIHRRLSRISPTLNEIQLTRVESLKQTIAGKTKMIYVESGNGNG